MEIKVEDKVYVVKKPGVKEINAAKKFSSVKFREYLQEGMMLRDELNDVLDKRAYWTEEKKNRLKEVTEKIESNVEELKKKLSKEKKKELAIQTKYLRTIFNLLSSQQNEVYKHTVETRVDDDYFDYLLSECVYTESGEKVYSSFEDYQERSTEELAVKAANKLAEIIYGLDPNWQEKLPENEILKSLDLLDDEMNIKE
jgi:methionyl-tRNA synthetase